MCGALDAEFATLCAPETLVTRDLVFVTAAWDKLAAMCARHTQLIDAFISELDAIEVQRAGRIGEKLTKLIEKLIGVAHMLPAEVERLAAISGLQLRTGCFCNPGACAHFLRLTAAQLREARDEPSTTTVGGERDDRGRDGGGGGGGGRGRSGSRTDVLAAAAAVDTVATTKCAHIIIHIVVLLGGPALDLEGEAARGERVARPGLDKERHGQRADRGGKGAPRGGRAARTNEVVHPINGAPAEACPLSDLHRRHATHFASRPTRTLHGAHPRCSSPPPRLVP
jgi:hypothetical protein